MGVITASEDIKEPIPGTVGTYQFRYRKGDVIRDEDLAELGPQQQQPPVTQDKAKRGPREAPKGAASRDKALSAAKEE